MTVQVPGPVERRIAVLTRKIDRAHRTLAVTFTRLHALHMERGNLMYGVKEEAKP